MRLYVLNGKNNIAGSRIRIARVKAGMSQEILAVKLQLKGLESTQMSVSRTESGLRVIPDFELPVYASVLHVSTNWLLGLECHQEELK